MTTEEASDAGRLGWPTIAWFSFMILGNCWVAYRFGEVIYSLVRYGNGGWDTYARSALPFLMALALVNVIGLVLLVARRKIGLYIVLAATAIALIVNASIGVPPATLLLSLVG